MNQLEDILSIAAPPQVDYFTIREATLEDIPTLIAHRHHMYQDMGYENAAQLEALETQFAQWLKDRLEDGRYHNWFALAPNGDIAAGAGLWVVDWPPQMMDFSPFRGYVMNVYTEPAYRKRGLARHLIQTIATWCVQHNIHTVSLHASPDGRPVYEALGFGATNELRLKLP